MDFTAGYDDATIIDYKEAVEIIGDLFYKILGDIHLQKEGAYSKEKYLYNIAVADLAKRLNIDSIDLKGLLEDFQRPDFSDVEYYVIVDIKIRNAKYFKEELEPLGIKDENIVYVKTIGIGLKKKDDAMKLKLVGYNIISALELTEFLLNNEEV